jgi:hypothetical protein
VSNISKKHHFIPVFYQKGFLSSEYELFAYKKKFGSIKNWSPSQLMYEKNLHTMNLGDEKTVMLEEFYSQIEGEFNKYISLINDNINNKNLLTELTNDGNFQRLAKLMVAIQFWRTPCRRQQTINYAPKLVSLYDSTDEEIKEIFGYDRKFIKFLSKRVKKDDSLKVIQFLLLPLLTFDLSTKVIKLKLFKATKEMKFVSSDRPVVYDVIEDLFNLRSFLFPFSKELLLVGTDKDVKVINIEKVNLLIANKASEVVISGSKEQLENLKCRLTQPVLV